MDGAKVQTIMTDTTNDTKLFKSRTDDELGVHILEDIAGHSNQAWKTDLLNMFADLGETLVEIDTLLAHDMKQAATMKKSRGVIVAVNTENARKIEWTARAFRDPIRLAQLTHDGDYSLSEAYLNKILNFFAVIRNDLRIAHQNGGEADLACNKGLRRFYINSLRTISHDMDFELVYNVFANSNLSGDASKPDWHSLIDNGPKKPPPGPRGGGPNNGGTPKGALVPFPSLNTNAVAKAA